MSAYTVILVIAVLNCQSWAFRVPNLASRIIGGTEADIEDFPYVAAFLYDGRHHCGASLISNNAVVTAAHCVKNADVNKISFRFGSSRWDGGGQEIFAKQYFIHENYTRHFDYDVAVVILSKNVKVENAIPISLAPADRQYQPDTLGVVLGWGQTEVLDHSEILLKVEMPIVEESICRQTYIGITPRHICAGNMEGGKSACHSDSGGPYVINRELAGIVSFGRENCSAPMSPVVYTSVPAFNSWIRQHASI